MNKKYMCWLGELACNHVSFERSTSIHYWCWGNKAKSTGAGVVSDSTLNTVQTILLFLHLSHTPGASCIVLYTLHLIFEHLNRSPMLCTQKYAMNTTGNKHVCVGWVNLHVVMSYSSVPRLFFTDTGLKRTKCTGRCCLCRFESRIKHPLLRPLSHTPGAQLRR